MRRVFPLTAAFGMTIVCASVALAQPPASGGQTAPGQSQAAGPPPMTNLQIYKDTPRPELIATMQGFAQALGVNCGYCHAGEAPQYDFASDAKRTKGVARKMIMMAREVNGKLPEAVGKSANDTTRLRCGTCHRGVAIPKLLPDILTETATKSGTAAAIEQYRDLRKRYYGGQSYDFSETGLVAFGQQLTGANKPDDAIAFLQLNAEFFPNSAPTYGGIAQAYMRKNDKANAIKSLEKAAQLDPNNPMITRQLEQLKK